MNTSLVTSKSDFYISITAFLIQDMSNYWVVPIPDGGAFNATNHTENTTPPELVEWDLDMDRGHIRLSFSETINAYTFNPEVITIQSSVFVEDDNEEIETYTLTGGNATTENITVIEFLVLWDYYPESDDLNELKRLTIIASNENISFPEELITDMNGNFIVPLPNGDAQPVSNFTEDTTPPFLHAFDIDMDSGEIILTFDETLNYNSLNITTFSLQASPNEIVETPVNTTVTVGQYTLEGVIIIRNLSDIVVNHILSGGEVDEGDTQVFRFRINFEDLNRIKRLNLGTEANRKNDCFIAFTENAFRDMNGNPVVPFDTLNAEQARFFTPDQNSPSLTQFLQFDLTDDRIRIQFNQTINISSFDPTQITLQRWAFQSVGFLPFENHTLTGGSGVVQLDDITLEFIPTVEDLSQIKQLERLCITAIT